MNSRTAGKRRTLSLSGISPSDGRLRLGWHFDLHTPDGVPVNLRPDAEGIAAALAEAGAEELITFAKCHYGHAYYPTRVGTRHPRMRGDPFGSILRACRARGIRVLAYVSFGIDGEAGERHPGWRKVRSDGTRDPRGWYVNVCPFTGYMDRLMLPQIREIAEAYRPDGLWFDTMSALAPCFCRSCRAAFQRETGHRIPVAPGDPLQARYGKWRHDRGIALVQRIAGFIQGLLPGATVGFNQLGSLPYPERMPEGVTVLSLDPATPGPQSVPFSLNAAFGVAAGIPCQVMPTIFNQGWGDWSLATKARREQVAVAVWARGAMLAMGDRLHPEIRLEEATRTAIVDVRSLRRELLRVFPTAEARLAPDTLVLHTPAACYGDHFESFATGDPRQRLERINGAHRLLLDSGANFGVVPEHNLGAWLEGAGLAILPEISSLSSGAATALRARVEQGGRLLVVGRVPRVKGRALDWLDIRPSRQPIQDHIYLPSLGEGAPTPPVLVRGDFSPFTWRGARVMARAIEPYHARHGVRYGWGIGPPDESQAHHAVLARKRMGRGEVWWLAVPVFTDYARHGNVQLASWFRGLLRGIGAPIRALIESPHGNLELVLWENAAETWAILVDHRGEQMVGEGRTWARTTAPTGSQTVTLRLVGRGSRKSRVSWSDGACRCRREGRDLLVSVQMRRGWGVLKETW